MRKDTEQKPSYSSWDDKDNVELLPPTPSPPPVAFEVREQYLKPQYRNYRSKVIDFCYFLVLLAIGILIIYLIEHSHSPSSTIAIILLNGGITPFLIFLWALITGPSLFKRRNIFKTISAIILIVVGSILMSLNSSTADALYYVATTLFSIGLLFFVSKAFMLLEDSEAYASSLLTELKTTRNSLAHGLAMGYFYNFLVPVCESISPRDNKTIVEIEIDRGVTEKTTLTNGYFFVVIPSSLPEDKIKESLGKGVKDKQFYSCKIMNTKQHRPMFFNVSQWDQNRCNGLFDVPTTIGTLLSYERIEAPKDYSMEEEITKFQNILIYLIAKHPHIAETIRIISVPWPLEPALINSAIEDALTNPPPEFAPGLSLSPILPHKDWLSSVENFIDKKDDE